MPVYQQEKLRVVCECVGGINLWCQFPNLTPPGLRSFPPFSGRRLRARFPTPSPLPLWLPPPTPSALPLPSFASSTPEVSALVGVFCRFLRQPIRPLSERRGQIRRPCTPTFPH